MPDSIRHPVIMTPQVAGIFDWIPAFAGMTAVVIARSVPHAALYPVMPDAIRHPVN